MDPGRARGELTHVWEAHFHVRSENERTPSNSNYDANVAATDPTKDANANMSCIMPNNILHRRNVGPTQPGKGPSEQTRAENDHCKIT